MLGKSDRERLQTKGQYKKGKICLHFEKELYILGTTDCQQLMREDIKTTMQTKDKEEGLDQETSSNTYQISISSVKFCLVFQCVTTVAEKVTDVGDGTVSEKSIFLSAKRDDECFSLKKTNKW